MPSHDSSRWCFRLQGELTLPGHQEGLPHRNALGASLDSWPSKASELIRGSLGTNSSKSTICMVSSACWSTQGGTESCSKSRWVTGYQTRDPCVREWGVGEHWLSSHHTCKLNSSSAVKLQHSTPALSFCTSVSSQQSVRVRPESLLAAYLDISSWVSTELSL